MKNVIVDIFNIPDNPIIAESVVKVFREVGATVLTKSFGGTRYSFFVEPGVNIIQLEQRIQDGLDDISIHFNFELEYVIEMEDATYQDFLSVPENRVTIPNMIDDLLIIPYGEVSEDPSLYTRTPKHTLTIDHSKTFGSGMHSSTVSIIYGLKNYLTEGCTVLDIGAGDGILSLYASLIGAGSVCCVDNDPISEEAIRDNASINQIDLTNYTFKKELQDCTGTYDMITMNLPPHVSKNMLRKVDTFMHESSKLLLSGFFIHEIQSMKEEVETIFKIIDIIHIDNWTLFVCTK